MRLHTYPYLGLLIIPSAVCTTVVLFSQTYNSIRPILPLLASTGYTSLQISPPAEHIPGSPWWTAYQPVSYNLNSRLGSRSDLQNLINEAHDHNITVIADAVINHMASGSGTGTGGSRWEKYNYPGLYSSNDMRLCRSSINNYQDRWNVQNCELVGLPDLDTAENYVQASIAKYLNDLISLGIDGFRVDAAKHIAASELAEIKARLSNNRVLWKQEVIHGANEAVQPQEYVSNGLVQEFRYATSLKRVFTTGNLAELKNFGEPWGFLKSSDAAVFVDNHDTEREGTTLTYKDGSKYTLALVFMLAWPYGSPDVHSGYEFATYDAGPPNNGAMNECWVDGWRCQWKWKEVSAMVGFRRAAEGLPMVEWWDDQADVVAFGRGTRGYVVINNGATSVRRRWKTQLAAGSYCNVLANPGWIVQVDANGEFEASVGAGAALALHTGAKTCS